MRMARPGRCFFIALLCLIMLFPAAAASSLAVQGFYESAFQGEYGDTQRGATIRWTGPIVILMKGDYTGEDVAVLARLLYSLAENVKNLPQLSLTTLPAGANVTMDFVPYERMRDAVPDYQEGNVGFVRVNYEAYTVSSAQIAISSTASQKKRSAVIREEVVNMLGLLNDITLTRRSIISKREKKVSDLTNIDYEMLNLLYSPLMPPGTTLDQAREILGE